LITLIGSPQFEDLVMSLSNRISMLAQGRDFAQIETK
jgi:hypothetical protein